MARTAPFDENPLKYEEWFEDRRFVYQSELRAIEEQLPENGVGLEIGVGSGRFAAPLGINIGIEPSAEMRKIAKERGIMVVGGVAENLPFNDAMFNFVLMVTTICFLDDVEAALREIYRVLIPGGVIIIGFVDKNSSLGKSYQERRSESPFYRIASFFSVDEVISYLKKAGFKEFELTQTIFHELDKIRDIEPVVKGHGRGSFVVIRAVRKNG